MHILGLQGMSRRIQTYRDGLRLRLLEPVATIGAFLIALSVAVLLLQHLEVEEGGGRTCRRRDPTRGTPAASSGASRRPRPTHNFDDDPIVTELDHWWHQKYGEDEQGRVVRHRQARGGRHARRPVPRRTCRRRRTGRSCCRSAFPLIGYGLIFNMTLAGIGGAVLLAGMVGWALEPPDDEDLPPHGHDDHDDDDGGDGDEAAEPELEAPADADAGAGRRARGGDRR